MNDRVSCPCPGSGTAGSRSGPETRRVIRCGELRDHVLAAHVGPITVVRPKENVAVKVASPVVDGKEFTDDLAAAV